MLSVGSLLSGCLGLDLGLAAADYEFAWACEADEACRRVIAEREPGLEVVPDVREIDGGVPPVDVLAGGFPCPDFSVAGGRSGMGGDGSSLWLEFARCIRLLRPRLVLVENVPGLLSAPGLDEHPGESAVGVVLADLAAAGYVGRWLCLRASDLGAPHRRERLFILAADAERERLDGSGARDAGAPAGGGGWAEPAGSAQAPPDSDHAGRGEHARPVPGRAQLAASVDGGPAPADADGAGRPAEWGAYADAVLRWEAVLGRPAPRPVDARGRLEPAFVEWMMGFPHAWTDVPEVGRTARLRMLGNAVQVQVGEAVGRLLRDREAA